MKAVILLLVVVCVGCGGGKEKVEAKNPEPPKEAPKKLIADPVVEKAIRHPLQGIDKRTGELTEADLEEVTSLFLSASKITDAGLKDLAKLQNLAGLALSNTQITDAGLEEVAKLKQLKSLLLNSTQITDAGLKEVAKLQQLKALVLTGNQITAAGVAELQKALPKCKIISNPKK